MIGADFLLAHVVGLDLQDADHAVADFVVAVDTGAELVFRMIIEVGPEAFGSDFYDGKVRALGGLEQRRAPGHASGISAEHHLGIGELRLDFLAVAFLERAAHGPKFAVCEIRNVHRVG